MDQLEKVEKLREKTGVSYDEAKKALEANDWDVLDAIVYLEAQGKVTGPEVSSYTTKAEMSEEFQLAAQSYEENSKRATLGEMLDRFLKWCGKIIRKGCDSSFHVQKNERNVISLPVIVLVLLLIVAFWPMCVLMLIGLFCGFKYSFHGDIAQTINLNDACDKASETCENIKNEFTGK